MKKFRMSLIFILSFITILNAQNRKIRSVDKSILSIPDSLTTSTKGIAGYINSNYRTEENKLRAVFIWITENIQYDIENMYTYNQDLANSIDKTLKTRKGVCQNYTGLFQDIASKVGVKSYVVFGYTKDYAQVNYNPHSWCVAQIDSSWYMFDPTWGAGSTADSKFIKKLNDGCYKMLPKKSIKTHMPFDPLWQFLDYPITNNEFCQDCKNSTIEKTFFNYRDSLELFDSQDCIDRLIAEKKRTEGNKINSYLIYIRTQQLERDIQSYYTKHVSEKYDLSNNSFKDGIYLLNCFIDYRNDRFLPDKGDAYLKQMLANIEDKFKLSKEYLDSIEKPKPNTLLSMKYLYKSIESAMVNVAEQKVFLDKVLKTKKQYRKSLFYDKM